jgi:hypothetical protein
MMATEIERIVNNFQNVFHNDTLADLKDQIRRFISAIVVHRTEQPRTRCYTRKIPLINQSTGFSLRTVAGERHTTQGKIQLPPFPLEISTSNWEEYSFSFKNKSCHPFRLIELPNNNI